MLDLAIISDQMLVLEPRQVVRFDHSSGSWKQLDVAELNAPPIRDPRGRMKIQQDKLSVFLPGATCRGTWQPLSVVCDPVSADFTLGTAQVHFTPGRNTIEGDRAPGLEGWGDFIPCEQNPAREQGERQKTLASGTGGMDSNDTVTLFDGATPISEAAEFPGPVTALWPSPEGALAVVLNLSTKQYVAYALAVDCGR
jgi:hypothetical protein